ncbi:hypothetical protein HC174_08740 [Salinimicrobium sp. CDJ15-81-2]|nr:hypothetical protein [Salinimicrobium nanhaiense]
MKNTNLKFKINTLSGYDFYPFIEVTNLIKWSLEQRNNSSDFKLKSSINYNIVLQCSTFLEGSIGQIFDSVIEFRKINVSQSEDKYKIFTLRSLEEFDDKIEKAQWNNYPEIFHSLFGYKLSSKMKDEIWEAIQVMFRLRSVIAHGNILTIEYFPIDDSNRCEIKVLKKYNNIYEYFSKKKLVEKDAVGFVNLMNDKIADYFVEKTSAFITEIVNAIEDKSEKSIVKNRLMYINEKNRALI